MAWRAHTHTHTHARARARSVSHALALESFLTREERALFPVVWRGDWQSFSTTYMAAVMKIFLKQVCVCVCMYWFRFPVQILVQIPGSDPRFRSPNPPASRSNSARTRLLVTLQDVPGEDEHGFRFIPDTHIP